MGWGSYLITGCGSPNGTHVRGIVHTTHAEVQWNIKSLHLQKKITLGRIVVESISTRKLNPEFRAWFTSDSAREHMCQLIRPPKSDSVNTEVLRESRRETIY